ncbi:MAG: MFS transporter [Actinobacteria bacterium]|jgi:MFS family permease|nr:MAG: MFS transporter [Actinomycetota bacterium]
MGASSASIPPLRANRQLMILLSTQSIGLVARAIYFVGLPLFVLERTGSAFSMSISLFLGFAPFTLAGPFAGSIVDRFSRRDLLVITNLLYGITLFILPFAHAVWLIYVIAFTASIFGVILANSMSALLPELVDVTSLAKANSLYTFLRSASFLLSTAAAFFLIKAMGKADIFFLCSALLVAGGISCLALRRDLPRAAAAGGLRAGAASEVAGLKEALRIIRTDRHIRGLTLMHLMFMPIFGAFEVFLPLFCGDKLGQVDYYTLVSSAVGAGLALGSLLTYRLLGRVRPLNLVFASFLGYAAGMLLLTGTPVLVLAILVCFLLGIVDGFGFTTYEYLRQRIVPSAYRGRVFAVMDAVVLLPMPLGYLVVGWFADRTSITSLGIWLSVIGFFLALLCFPLTRGLPELEEALGG